MTELFEAKICCPGCKSSLKKIETKRQSGYDYLECVGNIDCPYYGRFFKALKIKLELI